MEARKGDAITGTWDPAENTHPCRVASILRLSVIPWAPACLSEPKSHLTSRAWMRTGNAQEEGAQVLPRDGLRVSG